MNYDSDSPTDILSRLPGMVDDVRGGRVNPFVLVAGAAGLVAAFWLGLKLLRLLFKAASVFAVVTALLGGVMYFIQRERGDEDGDE